MQVPRFVHPVVYWWTLSCPHFLLLLWKRCRGHWCASVCSSLFSVLLSMYLGAKLPDHMGILCSAAWSNTELSHSDCATCHPVSSVRGPPFSQPHRHWLVSILKNIVTIAAILRGVKCFLTAVWLAFSYWRRMLTSFQVLIGRLRIVCEKGPCWSFALLFGCFKNTLFLKDNLQRSARVWWIFTKRRHSWLGNRSYRHPDVQWLDFPQQRFIFLWLLLRVSAVLFAAVLL